MPFEQRRELERKEHDVRMKAISAALDEREKAGAARGLMEVRSQIRRGRIGQVQHLLAGIAAMGSGGITAMDITGLVAPRGAHLFPPEQRDRWGKEIAEALLATGVLVARDTNRFVLQECVADLSDSLDRQSLGRAR